MAEVVTGEAVILDVPCARFPSRLLAQAIDLIIQITLLTILFAITGAFAVSGRLNDAAASAVGITLIALVIVGYPVTWETVSRGRSAGKLALGLRVVSDDGGPERFRQALVRGLAAVVEIWLLVGCPALICSLLSARGKRLGDLFAGTFVIQQRLPRRRAAGAVPGMPPELAHWAAGLEMSGLSEQTAGAARRYLARMPELTQAAAAELGERIAAAVRAQVSPPPPPGTPAPVYLSAVLAARHGREQARQASGHAGSGYGIPPQSPTPAAHAPAPPAAAPSTLAAPTPAPPTLAPAAPGPLAPDAAPAASPSDDQPQDGRPREGGGFVPPA